MSAFDHVTIRIADYAASVRFYATVLGALGVDAPAGGEDGGPEFGDFSLLTADAEHPVTRDLHVGFVAPSREAVDAFWHAGTAAGHPDDGAPGERPQYRPGYYGAFLHDPDGNSAEAVHHGDVAERSAHGVIDHLWVGVADLAATRGFYEAIAPHAGLQPPRTFAEHPDLIQTRGPDGGSCSFVADGRPPTRHLHIAFPAPDRATVDAFHAAATRAGYADLGAPGERPHYHPGYYGAFVADPDASNLEVVFHDR